MPVFKRLIQNPSSPEASLKKLSGSDKYKQATFARLADVNDLSKDVNDQKLYTLDASTAATGSVAITSKRGVVKVTNASTSSTTFTLTLTNSELVTTSDYFIQVSVGSATTMVPSVKVIPVTTGQFGILITTTSAIDWSTNPTYINYTIVRIGD